MKARRRRKFFYRLCRNRTHTINEILNEIEKQNRRKRAAGEKYFTLCFLNFRTVNPRRGGILIFRTGGVLQNLRGAIYPRRGGVEITLINNKKTLDLKTRFSEKPVSGNRTTRASSSTWSRSPHSANPGLKVQD